MSIYSLVPSGGETFALDHVGLPNAPSSLSEEMEFIRFALDSAAIVAITDVKGTISFVNRKFCEISGYNQAELVGANHRILKSDVHSKSFFRAMFRQISSGRVWHGEICNKRKDGTLYWVDTTIVPHKNKLGKVDSYTSIRFDITSRRLIENQLRLAVSFDPLTGIANRSQFVEGLDERIALASELGHQVHLALLDVDHFKDINDQFGHDVGDTLLKIVGQRLNGFKGEDVFVARMGGDEFAIVFVDHSDLEVGDAIESVLRVCREPVNLGGCVRHATVSAGLAVWPDDALASEELIKAADMALYRAKDLGRDRFSKFEESLRQASILRNNLHRDIQTGLEERQFVMHYQPVVSATGSDRISLEALIRWNHPTDGLVGPGRFLADLNAPGLEARLSRFVLEQSVTDLRHMLDRGLPIRSLAINVGNVDLRSDAFSHDLEELCSKFQIQADMICIEVTERVLMGRASDQVEKRLRRLKEVGVTVAFDDFGTGFASLAHLRNLPFDVLKIDRSFVAQITTSSSDQVIVQGLVDIAHTLGKTVVAEGVETAHQAALLTQYGCDHLQGWLFDKALPLDDIATACSRLTIPTT